MSSWQRPPLRILSTATPLSNTVGSEKSSVDSLEEFLKCRQSGRSRKTFTVDATFIAYPRLLTENCSVVWRGQDESFCLDVNNSKQIERAGHLTIRGENGTIYTVTGSTQPTANLDVLISGARSGFIEGGRVKTDKKLLVGISSEISFYAYHGTVEKSARIGSGDSGGPIYTVPDANGNVRIVGVLFSAGLFGETVLLQFLGETYPKRLISNQLIRCDSRRHRSTSSILSARSPRSAEPLSGVSIT